MLKEFRDFAMRGNVIDLAVALILGAAFGKIITSLVNDIIMPPIGLLLGRVDFANLFINLSGQAVKSVAEAKAAGLPTINYGTFINSIIEFVIVAFALFLVVRQMNRMTRAKSAAEGHGKDDEDLKDTVKEQLKEAKGEAEGKGRAESSGEAASAEAEAGPGESGTAAESSSNE